MNRKNNKYMNNLLAALFLAAVCTGCQVGPNYKPVSVDMPEEWPFAASQQSSAVKKAESENLAQWWTTLKDPVLSDLVNKALSGNKDLKIALTRIRQARAVLGSSNKDLYPSVTGSALYSRTQSGVPGAADPDPSAFSIGSNYYDTGFDASWEIDLFGKNHRTIEAAAADLEASEEGCRSVQISMVSEVADSYVRLRTLQKQLEIVTSNLKIQQKSLSIVEDKAEAGLIGSLQVQQARYNVESTRASIPAYRVSIEETLNTLAILLGEMPGTLHEKLSVSAPIPVPDVAIAVGIPADILRRRPDIRQAERALAAQTARIGAATAELYPTLSLSGALGLTASSLDNYFSKDNTSVSISPFISIPVFSRKKIRDQIEVQNAIQERTLIEYETAVLDAVKEVRDAVMAYGEEQKRYLILKKGTDEAQKAYDIADERFRAGLVDFMDVLDAQRALLSFENNQISSQGAIIQDLIRMYKALGGGWDTES